MAALYAILAVIAVILIALIIFAFMIYRTGFCRRADFNPHLKYFTANELGLKREKVTVHSRKAELAGFIYSAAVTSDRVVIFCHGMGPGHSAYMKEIAYFCAAGYRVLAVDYEGCGYSKGKSMRGFYSGVLGVDAAIDFACANLGGDVVLVGHSWGGYSALCAAAERKVKGVVALGAPASPSSAICSAAATVISAPLARLIKPFVALWCFIFGGARGNRNSVRAIESADTPALLIHGDKDTSVPPSNAAAFKVRENGKIVRIRAHGKGHNPYNTVKAEKWLATLQKAIVRAPQMTADERAEFFATFDYNVATEQDEQIMGAIADFIGKIS